MSFRLIFRFYLSRSDTKMSRQQWDFETKRFQAKIRLSQKFFVQNISCWKYSPLFAGETPFATNSFIYTFRLITGEFKLFDIGLLWWYININKFFNCLQFSYFHIFFLFIWRLCMILAMKWAEWLQRIS